MSKQQQPAKRPETVPIQSVKAPKVLSVEFDRFIEPVSRNGTAGGTRVEACKGWEIEPCELGFRVFKKAGPITRDVAKYVCTIPHARVVFVTEDV